MQQRRRQQHGTIVQIAGRWFVRFYRDVNENGVVKRKRVSHCLGAVEGRATKHPPYSIKQAAEEHVRKTVDSKIIQERAGLSVAQFVEQTYIPMLEETKRPATAAQSHGIWQRHLKLQLLQIGTKRVRAGNLMIQDTETYHVQSWLDAVAASTERPLSKSVLKQCKFFLSGAFRLALQRGYRPTANGHPVENTSIPARTIRQSETHAYSTEEILGMLRVLEEPARTIVMLMAETGLRVSELKGLRWEDLKDGVLTINRSVWKKYVLEPKTAASKAPIAVSRQLSQVLEMHRAIDGFPTAGPIFRTGLGTPLGMDNVRSRQILPVLNRCAVCKKARGKPHLTEQHEYQRDETMPRWHGWHAFRRGLATDLVEKNVAVTVAQGALRHADANVTLRHYTKPVDEAVRRSVQERADRLQIGLMDTFGTVKQPSGAKPDAVN